MSSLRSDRVPMFWYLKVYTRLTDVQHLQSKHCCSNVLSPCKHSSIVPLHNYKFIQFSSTWGRLMLLALYFHQRLDQSWRVTGHFPENLGPYRYSPKNACAWNDFKMYTLWQTNITIKITIVRGKIDYFYGHIWPCSVAMWNYQAVTNYSYRS